mmetsp:Transcript_48370/g.104173  ORF Transcript_48370/g.104173 Transcript_48370/m.104173 type:complete len:396 (-) Transcript_48370:363-1550(-)
MGNKVFCHARVILTEDIALNFKSSNLVRDVLPIILTWRADGAELCFDVHKFQSTFDVVEGVEQQFAVFDTDSNGKVDAHEVLMVYILLSTGDLAKKIEAVFSTFEFQAGDGNMGSINFDEAMIILESCVRGVQKVCSVDFHVENDEIFFHCKSLFDRYKTGHHDRITRKQFCDWCLQDPSPAAFLHLFQDSQGLPDIYSMVQQVNLRQSQVFQMAARGQLYVSVEDLLASDEFRRLLRNVDESEVTTLVHLMADSHGRIGSDRYHSVLRPWNIFDACDLDGTGDLDCKEMEILLWIHLRTKPTMDLVKQFLEAIDADGSGTVDRLEWVSAIVESHGGVEPTATDHPSTPHHTSEKSDARRRPSVDIVESELRRLSLRQESHAAANTASRLVGAVR